MATSKVTKLQKKSEDAIGIFRNTIANLAGTNTEVAHERARKQEQIQNLQDEDKVLEAIEVKNTKFIQKIQSFLEE